MLDFNLAAASLASALVVLRQNVNEFLRDQYAVTPIIALRLSHLSGNFPEFWLNTQHPRDLWDSEQFYNKQLSLIQLLNAA